MFNYKICIPSYKRPQIIKDRTLKLLERLGIPNEGIDIIVETEPMAQDYNEILDNKYNIIVSNTNGIKDKRNFVRTYYQNKTSLEYLICIDDDIVLKLESLGIKNTFQLYDYIKTHGSRTEFLNNTGISKENIMLLTKLTDLSRIRWVNHTFAYVLYEANYTTAKDVSNADCNELYETIKKLNSEREIYKGNIGVFPKYK